MVFTFFLTSVPSNSHFFFIVLFYIQTSFPFSFHCYTSSLSLPSFCLLSLSLLTLPPLSTLSQAMGSFYRNELKLPLSWWDRRPLFSLWHLFNVISDLVITAGTLLKILLNFNVSETSPHLPCHRIHILDFISPFSLCAILSSLSKLLYDITIGCPLT